MSAVMVFPPLCISRGVVEVGSIVIMKWNVIN